MNIKLKSDECALVIRAEGGDIFVSGGETAFAERSRYLLAIALHALQAEEDDAELWKLLEGRIEKRAQEYEEAKPKRRFRVIRGGLDQMPSD